MSQVPAPHNVNSNNDTESVNDLDADDLIEGLNGMQGEGLGPDGQGANLRDTRR